VNRFPCSIALVTLVALLGLLPAAQAKDDPVIFSARPDGGLLVIEGTDLVVDEWTEPSVTLGDQLLVVANFTTTEIQSEMPSPPSGMGTFLLTVESKKNKVGVFWVALGAPVPRTGQATELDAGEDGDLQKGVPWPDPRFTDNLDGTVTDNLTGLVWLQSANSCFAGRIFWTVALSDINGLSNGDCGLADGSEEGAWRLPNVQELQSLIDYGEIEIMLPAGHPFDLDLAGYPFLQDFWSSTSHEGGHCVINDEGDEVCGKTLAYHVHLGNGSVGLDGKWGPGGYYVWPVRDGQ